MLRVRLLFEKTGPARYISHLDLTRTFQRAFRRADLPLSYSEGFNPHPYLSVARPLPVGVSSFCELLDFGLEDNARCTMHNAQFDNTLPGQISAALPIGLRVTGAYPAARKFQEIAWAVYTMELSWDGPADGTCDCLNALFDGRPLPVIKKSKKGMVEINAAALVRDVALTAPDEGCVVLRAGLAAGETSLGPGTLLEALLAAAGDDLVPWARAGVTRLALLDNRGEVFR